MVYNLVDVTLMPRICKADASQLHILREAPRVNPQTSSPFFELKLRLQASRVLGPVETLLKKVRDHVKGP